MKIKRDILLLAAVSAAFASCGPNDPQAQLEARDEQIRREMQLSDSSFFDLFRNQGDPEIGVQVNRYLWQATLDILAFLPLEGADPFSGIIMTDWGRIGNDPSGYRVTAYIMSPALDARSLKVAAYRQSGGRPVPVSREANKALENAILTRARQLRIAATEGTPAPDVYYPSPDGQFYAGGLE
ncbi:DUF3576 domain-containing protein [Amaricoccus sp.]|uniref:DUF3576 domain-containing protein n=1 Tax=Amaricoccus sp. TaxID=1872485 RepID=UPI002CC2EED1|nr:DUF3576 domain-containing protein [Amaricoccus sp.]HRW13946.1 DUF3576 domain-containing protein [Amaricoccus sp.]